MHPPPPPAGLLPVTEGPPQHTVVCHCSHASTSEPAENLIDPQL